jgi:aminodeoxyfutalosine deaminase
MTFASYVCAAPKAELHTHLEGSIPPRTLLSLAARNGVPLHADGEDGLRRWFTYRSFAHFIEVFAAVTTCLRTEQDYELIAYEYGAEMARQHCRYAEVTFTPSIHHERGVPFDVYFAGLTRGRRRAWDDFDVEMNWVFDIKRGATGDGRCRQLAEYTVATAIEGRSDGVVALGLGGMEAKRPPEFFSPYFDRARAAGLHSAPHAGETVGPASIWGALRSLGAERLEHGVRAVEDPALVAYLAAQRIALDLCPTSNVRLGVYRDYTAHPLPLLHAAGCVVTVNADDPTLFGTTLNHEVSLLGERFGLSLRALDEVLLNAVRCSFLPTPRRRALEAEFSEEMAALRILHGVEEDRQSSL